MPNLALKTDISRHYKALQYKEKGTWIVEYVQS